MILFIISFIVFLLYIYFRLNYLDKSGILDRKEIGLKYVDEVHEYSKPKNLYIGLVLWVFIVFGYKAIDFNDYGRSIIALIQLIAGTEIYIYTIISDYYKSVHNNPIYRKIIYDLAATLMIATLTIYGIEYILYVVLYIVINLNKMVNPDKVFVLMKKLVTIVGDIKK